MRILRQADREGAPAGVPASDPVRGVQAAPGTPVNRPLGAPGRPRRVGVLLATAVFVIAADVISKSIVVAKMPDHRPIRLLGGLLTLTLTRNGGAAFRIGTSLTIVFTAIALGVVIYLPRPPRNLRSTGWGIPLGLLAGRAPAHPPAPSLLPPAPLP